MGTDGFEFVEFCHPEPAELDRLFTQMGFVAVAKHRSKQVTLYRQGGINLILNAEPGSFAAELRREARPLGAGDGVPRGGREVRLRARAVARRQADRPHRRPRANWRFRPSRASAGCTSISSTATATRARSTTSTSSGSARRIRRRPALGLWYIDHLTHNVYRGRLGEWAGFYERIFNFRQIRYFDIAGRMTGLHSRAMTSPDGKIRIPINEDAGEQGQIEEYLQQYGGEGIQHIALGAHDLYASIEAPDRRAAWTSCRRRTRSTIPASISGCRATARIWRGCRQNGILIDGEGVVEGGYTKVLLQRFGKTAIGPIFFEFIQRKGDDGFGEGNFKALFESIEEDQIRRGVLKAGARTSRHGRQLKESAARRCRGPTPRPRPSSSARDVIGVECEGRRVALYRLDDGVFATSDVCPHQGASLAQGCVVQGFVECPLHFALFDIRTGEADGGDDDEGGQDLSDQGRARRHLRGPVRLRGDRFMNAGYMSGLRQRLRDRGAARRAADRPQLAAEVRLRPLCRAAERLAVHRAAHDQRALLALPHPADRGALGPVRARPTSACGAPRRATRSTCRSRRCAGARSPIPAEPLSFVEGVRTITTAGDAGTQAGMGAHVYLVTRSMEDEYFYNADGELLFVPQQGELRLWTEFGIIDIEPGEIAVIPRGVKIRVELRSGPARGYLCENYGGAFTLPERGPIGANCLANPRDFLTPVAAYEDRDAPRACT